MRLEEVRIQCKLWTPLENIKTASWNLWSPAETVDPNTEDDDPGISHNVVQSTCFLTCILSAIDFIQGLGRSAPPPDANQTHTATDNDMPSRITGPAFPVDPDADLGIPKRRDPDHLPPSNMFETVMTAAYTFILSLGTGNALFALKGGFLSVALSLPSLIKHTAEFAFGQLSLQMNDRKTYWSLNFILVNRFVWGMYVCLALLAENYFLLSIRRFMGQMALARFQGDTYFALWARVVSTFFGAIVGMVMWYVNLHSFRATPI